MIDPTTGDDDGLDDDGTDALGPGTPPSLPGTPLPTDTQAEGPNDALARLQALAVANSQTNPGTGRFLQTDPNSLSLRMLASAPDPGVLAAKEDLQATHVSPDQRQADEIENEAVAGARGKNDADAAFGDQMASRALTRAMAARTGMQQATDAGLLTPEHEMVTRAATADFQARQAPKYDAQADADKVKLAIAQMAQSGKFTTAELAQYAKLAGDMITANAHVQGSGFGGTGQANLGDLFTQIMNNRLGTGGGSTPQYKAGQYPEGHPAVGADGAKYVWHDAGANGPNFYPAGG